MTRHKITITVVVILLAAMFYNERLRRDAIEICNSALIQGCER